MDLSAALKGNQTGDDKKCKHRSKLSLYFAALLLCASENLASVSLKSSSFTSEKIWNVAADRHIAVITAEPRPIRYESMVLMRYREKTR